MLGSSRHSLEGASAALVARSHEAGSTGFSAVAADLFGVTRVLDANLDLRRMLSDSASISSSQSWLPSP